MPYILSAYSLFFFPADLNLTMRKDGFMLDKEINKTFSDKLRTRFAEIGLSKTISSKVAKLISNAVVSDKTVTSTCTDPFYLDQIITPQKNEIDRIVKMCWGNEFSFQIETKPKDKNSTKNLNLGKKESQQQNSNPSSFESVEISYKQNEKNQEKKNEKSALSLGQTRNLESELNFNNFVPCESNILAYNACESIIKNPGNLSNPLFIYGPTGLGKTHLLHSIGNGILKIKPDANVLYTTSSDFVNDIIHRGIKSGKMEEIRRKYNSCDILLVDDIQFLGNKDTCQIEFFHIFNELYQKKKPLVITGDKFPRDIPHIEERLKSRFLQGLLVHVEQPTFEDRVVLIEKKSKHMNLTLNRESCLLIATYAQTNIRELEGALKDLLVAKQMSGHDLTTESVGFILKRRFPNQIQECNVTIFEIQKSVCDYFQIKMSELMGQNRKKNFVLARHIAMFLAKEILHLNIIQISESFGKKDHTTALHAISKIKEMLAHENDIRGIIETIKKNLIKLSKK